MNGSKGYRGYISSRPFGGERAPQHVQNLVIRNYCERNGFKFLLSATELALPDCFLTLQQLLKGIEAVDGIVFYSIGQLPDGEHQKQQIFARLLETKRSIHFAVEHLSIKDSGGVRRVCELMKIKALMSSCLSKHDLRIATGVSD